MDQEPKVELKGWSDLNLITPTPLDAIARNIATKKTPKVAQNQKVSTWSSHLSIFCNNVRLYKGEKMYKKIVLVLLLSAISVSSFADEVNLRRNYYHMYSTMFLKDRFEQLEKDAEEFRTTSARSMSGTWILSLLYGGVTSAAKNDQGERYWEDIESKALRWVRLRPNSPTPHNVYASFVIQHGGDIRGSAYADKVKKENWQPFYAQLAKAKAYLLKNKQIASTDPRWYELMLLIARCEGADRTEFDELVNQAVARHPYYYPIYFEALRYLTPKWHGDKEEIEKFARFAVEKTKAKENSGMYARIYWAASQNQFENNLFAQSSVEWATMKKSIDDVLAYYPDQWNVNNFARFACLAQDSDKTKELMTRIVGAPISAAWDGDMELYKVCKAWAIKGTQ